MGTSPEEALSIAAGDTKEDAISVLYQLLKNSGETYFAFAKAETALHSNPQLRIRFDLGLDYRRHSLKELGLYHFKFLHEQNPEEAGSLHNLALLCADCDLPMTSVTHYKEAFALGETLSAANLGFTYLDSGMTDDATALIKEAISKDPHDPRVEVCLAEISQRAEREEKKESELITTAGGEREFLVKMGTALQAPLAEVDGPWEFPFGEMTLVRESQTLGGTAEITKKEAGLGGLLFGGPPGGGEPRTRTEKYTLKGTLKGAVCKFTITITQQGSVSLGTIGGILGGADSRTGFIVFADDGKSGTYAQVKDERLGDRERIVRIEK
jgi:tetratricopeptide (TPR) repeat protein